jgi:hypothetical protein
LRQLDKASEFQKALDAPWSLLQMPVNELITYVSVDFIVHRHAGVNFEDSKESPCLASMLWRSARDGLDTLASCMKVLVLV